MTTVRPVTLIVPPVPGGVVDYASLIADRMGSESRVTPFRPDLRIDSMSVVLQYSGYGYANRGVPIRLLHWLRTNRRRITRLGVTFHETYASGPLRSSAFWLSPAQRYIAQQIVRMCDFWVSSNELASNWLGDQALLKESATLPMFSNVGELDRLPEKDPKKIVVFGTAPRRERAWRAAGDRLLRRADDEGLALVDVGPPLGDTGLVDELRRAGVDVRGRRTVEEVSELLSSAAFGLIAYPPYLLAKSGVFAAYCAHAVVPVVYSGKSGGRDGVRVGDHYVRELPPRVEYRDFSDVSAQALLWYQGHRLDVHVSTMRRLLAATGSESGR